MFSRTNCHEGVLENSQKGLGGRQELMEVLEWSDDPAAQRLSEYLTNPQYARTSLRRGCHALRLNNRDLHAIYSRVLMAKAALEIAHLHAERMPGLVRETYADAMSRTATCSKCVGKGTIRVRRQDQDCPDCSGTGKVRTPGSTAARRLLFEGADLIKRGRARKQTMAVDKAVFFEGDR